MPYEKYNDLLRIAHKIGIIFKEERDKLPYGANVIEELHAGENAHSRILRMLLQYKSFGDYLVYSSFLNLLKKNYLDIPFSVRCHRPEFVNEEGRIDLLIKEYSAREKFAIIIENKVCGATDQAEQIQRYIEKVEFDGVPTKNIYVIYLTKDGEKEVSDYSLTEKARNKLGMTSSSGGRFFRINYRDHILPWLENDIYPNIPVKEDLLISSIRLYIDYLKGLFGEKNNEKTVYNKVRKVMKEELCIEKIGDCLSAYNDINFLQSQITSVLIEEAGKVMDDKFFLPLSEFLQTNYPEYEFEIAGKGNNTQNFWFDIFVNEWQKTKIRFTCEGGLGQYYGICHKDIDNRVDDYVIKGLKEKFVYGYASAWWPWYNTLKKKIESSDSENIWKDVDNGRLLKLAEDWIGDVIRITKDFEM